MKRSLCRALILFGLVAALNAVALAQMTTLKSHRLAGRLYVMVGDLASYYHLGRGVRDRDGQVEYQTPLASLSLKPDDREIELGGVEHWLSSPVLAARGELWLTPLDVLKTVDPVLRRGGVHPLPATCTVLIDPGHGGRDEGTHGARSREKDMTLDVARRVERALSPAVGLRVLMTRTGDVTTPLDQRVELCKSDHADLYVSIHFNSGGSADGIETYCVPPAGAPTTAHPAFEGERETAGDDDAVANNRFDEQNAWLAQCVQKSLLDATHANDRGVRRARFYVLRYASCPAILVEGGFLSNYDEEDKILTPQYREVLARAIVAGIVRYTGRTMAGRAP